MRQSSKIVGIDHDKCSYLGNIMPPGIIPGNTDSQALWEHRLPETDTDTTPVLMLFY